MVWFVDNDAARDGMIAAYSPSNTAMSLISAFYAAERVSPTYPWIARVASYSNPADLPSWGQLQQAAKLFQAAIVDMGVLPEAIMTDLLRVVSNK